MLFNGIDVKYETKLVSVKSTEKTDKPLLLSFISSQGEVNLEVDHLVLCDDFEPNTKIALEAGLEIDAHNGGIMVNAEFESRNGVYAAGDVASFHDVLLGRRRIEHHDHAIVTGRIAGRNMTGSHKIYNSQSIFWSDFASVSIEGIGITDSSLNTISIWANSCQKQTKFDKGVILYLSKDKVIVGVLLWNISNKISTARQLLSSMSVVDDINLIAKKFGLHQ
jgi:programmed cell death 8 (apoptosis-inducing factor)